MIYSYTNLSSVDWRMREIMRFMCRETPYEVMNFCSLLRRPPRPRSICLHAQYQEGNASIIGINTEYCDSRWGELLFIGCRMADV